MEERIQKLEEKVDQIYKLLNMMHTMYDYNASEIAKSKNNAEDISESLFPGHVVLQAMTLMLACLVVDMTNISEKDYVEMLELSIRDVCRAYNEAGINIKAEDIIKDRHITLPSKGKKADNKKSNNKKNKNKNIDVFDFTKPKKD